MNPRLTRAVVLAPLFALAGLVVASCGEASSASSTTVANMGPTNYQTLPPPSSTNPPTTLPAALPGQITTMEQSYTVMSGDYLNLIADMFQISPTAISNANGWDSTHRLYPGDVIKIPAGAIVPLPTTTTEETAPPTTQPCIQGTYTVKSGDVPSVVASKYGVTLQQLGAVNVDTKGFKAFLVGIKINIPCGG